MISRLRRILRSERGEIEDLPTVVILVVGLFLPLAGVLFFVGQYSNAGNVVQGAASAAARDASISRTAIDAGAHARSAAQRSLEGNVRCSSLGIDVDDSGFNTALGQTGTVSVTVTCVVRYIDFGVPFLPGMSTFTKTAVSPIDPYRER